MNLTSIGKMHIYQKKSNTMINKLIVIFVIITILTIFVIKRVEKYYINYAQIKTEQTMSKLLTKTMLSNSQNNNSYLKYTYDESGNILSVDTNKTEANRFISGVMKDLENILQTSEVDNQSIKKTKINMEHSNKNYGIIVWVPTMAALRNSIFNNFGPKIPVRVATIGHGDIRLLITGNDYGINNVLLKVYAELTLQEEVVLSTNSKTIKIKTKILLESKLLQGRIPEFYTNTYKFST